MAAAEDKLFGTYVDDVGRLLDLLWTTRSVVLGTAVLQCLLDSPSWDSKGLDITVTYASADQLTKSFALYEEYFSLQGYRREVCAAVVSGLVSIL
jgi:hypothetical protein